MALDYWTETRCLHPQTTVEAEIRRLNGFDLDKELLSQLKEEFAKINNLEKPPRIGQAVKIPVLKKQK